MKARYPYLFIAAFLVILLLPLRTLALDPNAIEDSFYGRGRLIQLIANLRVLMGDRVFPKVLVGEDGWLVFSGEEELNDFQKSSPYSQQELEQIQIRLDELDAHFMAQGTKLLLVVVPNKTTIYPEIVPNNIEVLGGQSKLEQLTAYLQEYGTTQILDLRPALRAGSAQQKIYYSTDTHWNDLGAFIAYQSIISSLADTYPELKPHPLSDFKVVTNEPEFMDLSNNAGTTLFPEARQRLVPQFDTHASYRTAAIGGRNLTFLHNPDESLPTLVLYHDSFFFRVNPLLGEHFHKGLLIQNYMAGGFWTLDWVEEEKPDVVIIEFSERYLKNLLEFIQPD